MSTGYPRNDGHPTRSYLYGNLTPQALVGDFAYENNDPAIFLARQSFLTKELAETVRRTGRASLSGSILHFCYMTWICNVWDAKAMRPTPTYEGIRRALQPVLRQRGTLRPALVRGHATRPARVRRQRCGRHPRSARLPVGFG